MAVSETRLGQALGLAYGLGPILAIVGSLFSQMLLSGAVGTLMLGEWPFPRNFAAVFAASILVLTLAAFLSSRLIIPLPEQEARRESFLKGVFGGFGHFLS